MLAGAHIDIDRDAQGGVKIILRDREKAFYCWEESAVHPMPVPQGTLAPTSPRCAITVPCSGVQALSIHTGGVLRDISKSLQPIGLTIVSSLDWGQDLCLAQVLCLAPGGSCRAGSAEASSAPEAAPKPNWGAWQSVGSAGSLLSAALAIQQAAPPAAFKQRGNAASSPVTLLEALLSAKGEAGQAPQGPSQPRSTWPSSAQPLSDTHAAAQVQHVCVC